MNAPPDEMTRWTTKVSFPPVLGGNVTPHNNLEAIALGKLSFHGKAAVHRVARKIKQGHLRAEEEVIQ
jgi:hypothetical protein